MILSLKHSLFSGIPFLYNDWIFRDLWDRWQFVKMVNSSTKSLIQFNLSMSMLFDITKVATSNLETKVKLVKIWQKKT